MMNKPKISVIVPVYGVEKSLKQCVDSILNQTFQDFEVLLLDDGGKDACPQIIDNYAQKDSRVIAIHKQNSGYGATVNLGLERANGDYIVIIEPDDYIEPEMFADLYNNALKSDADIVKSAYYTYFYTKHYKRQVLADFAQKFTIPNKPFTLKECPEFLAMHPSIWSGMYKKSFLNNNKIRLVEAPGAGWTDNPFQVQTMCLAQKIVYVAQPYYHWRVETLRDEDALKDYTIPFKRSEEIHNWLKEQNIMDKGILKSLYKREVSYTFLVLNKNELTTAQDRIEMALKFAKTLEVEVLSLLSQKEQKQIKLLKEHPYFCYMRVHFKKFIQTIFKLKWNRYQKCIILFGRIYNFSK